MSTTMLSKDEILEAIGKMSVLELADLIEAFIRMMDTPDDFTGPVNLGNAQEFTIRELATLVIKMTNSRSTIVSRPLPADDPKQRRPDASLAQSRLGWQASTPLAEGLQHTIAYFDSLLTEKGDRSS